MCDDFNGLSSVLHDLSVFLIPASQLLVMKLYECARVSLIRQKALLLVATISPSPNPTHVI